MITTIIYNHLNLPAKIAFASAGNIAYIYNAQGQKLQKIVSETGRPVITTDYLGEYQYENSVLKFFPTAEGYVEPSAGSYKYVYQYKDHLGNIRLSYDKNLVIQEESNYYPFGLKQEGYNNVKIGIENKYKYNGKELQDELGLNFYDYGARNYDPALGRWVNIDPIANKFFSESPYIYVNNDPLGYADIDGKDYIMTIEYDKNGKFRGVKISGNVYIQGDGASAKRADELNKYAKSNIKGGKGVSVDINYAYNTSKNSKNLKEGENILNFNSKLEGSEEGENTSQGQWKQFTNKEFKNRWLTGNTATIFSSGQDNYTVIHETLHLFGLADRYDDYRKNKNSDFKGSIPFPEFENNIMAEDSTNPSLHEFQYKQWYEHAKSRAKSHNNPERIIGKMAVDKIGDFTLMPDGTRRVQKK